MRCWTLEVSEDKSQPHTFTQAGGLALQWEPVSVPGVPGDSALPFVKDDTFIRLAIFYLDDEAKATEYRLSL